MSNFMDSMRDFGRAVKTLRSLKLADLKPEKGGAPSQLAWGLVLIFLAMMVTLFFGVFALF